MVRSPKLLNSKEPKTRGMLRLVAMLQIESCGLV